MRARKRLEGDDSAVKTSIEQMTGKTARTCAYVEDRCDLVGPQHPTEARPLRLLRQKATNLEARSVEYPAYYSSQLHFATRIKKPMTNNL